MNELEEKIYNGEKLEENELCEVIIFEYGEVVDEIEGSCGRWTRNVQTIIKIKDKLFAIDWQRGLTESQEHEFYDQPYEVVRKTRMVEETYYEEKDNAHTLPTSVGRDKTKQYEPRNMETSKGL